MTNSLCICDPGPDLRQYAHFNDRLMPQSPPLTKSNDGRAPHRRAPLYLRQTHRKTLTRRQEPVLEHVVVENTFRRGNGNNSISYSERHIPPRRTDWPIAPTVTLTHCDTTCNAVKLNEKLTQIPALNLLAQRCTNNQFCAKKLLSCSPFLQADPGLRNPRKSHA